MQPLNLISQIKKSNQAFEKLFREFEKDVLSYAYYFLKNHELAQEITQEAFIKFYRELENQEIKYPKAFLFSVTKNLALNRIRTQNRRLEFQKKFERETHLRQTESSQNTSDNLLQRIEGFLQNVPSKLQEIWNFRSQGLSTQEIAEKMKVPQGTVKSRSHKLFKMIAKEIDHEN